MKPLLLIGLALLVLGLVSLVIPIPHGERNGFNPGDVSLGIEPRHSESVPPIISAVLILAGAAVMIGATVKKLESARTPCAINRPRADLSITKTLYR